MLEPATTGTKRLVLAFDGGCATCGDLATRISEKVGDKLEVRSLHHPQVERWREQALGKDAPWAPTLFEVGGTRGLRAWTGPRMAVRLTHVLGPVGTWRVMQALGETRSANVEARGPLHVAEGSALSRGQFLKGMGGAALALGLLSGVPSTALAKGNSINEDALTEVLSAIEDIPERVLDRGKDATSQWLRDRLGIDSRAHSLQQRGILSCVAAVLSAIASGVFPILKLRRIRSVIKAFGSTYKFVRVFVGEYRRLRRLGLGFKDAIRAAAFNATRKVGLGREYAQAVADFFGISSVIAACLS